MEAPREPHSAAAQELLYDWRQGVVALSAPVLLLAEIMSAFLRAYRRGRVTQADATDAIRDLVGLPFVLHPLAPALIQRAFAIARQHNLGSYDCLYVALAEQEGIDFWTADRRLYNALHGHFTAVRWLGDYTRKRP